MDDDLSETFLLKTEPDSDTESIGFQQEENSRSETVTWTPDKTRQLIDLYKSNPELWDSKHYRTSKATREMKMEILADVFNTTTEEIGRKLHNLRTQFSHQLRKIKRKMAEQDTGGGVVTVPWEYFEDLSFLIPTTVGDALEGFSVELAEFQAKEEAQFGAAARANATLPSLQSAGSSEQETSDVDKFAQRDLPKSKSKPPEKLPPKTPPPKAPILKTPDAIPSPRRACGSRVAASAPPPLPPSANPLLWPEEPVPRIQPSNHADECQIFGDFVASELRILRSDESRKRLKRMIQKAILHVGEEEDVNIISTG